MKEKKTYSKPVLAGRKVFTASPHSCCKIAAGASQPCNRPSKLGAPVANS